MNDENMETYLELEKQIRDRETVQHELFTRMFEVVEQRDPKKRYSNVKYRIGDCKVGDIFQSRVNIYKRIS